MLCGLTKREAVDFQQYIDGASRFLGPHHRCVNHKLSDVMPFIVSRTNNSVKFLQYVVAFQTHIYFDGIGSANKKMKAMLEMMPTMHPLP